MSRTDQAEMTAVKSGHIDRLISLRNRHNASVGGSKGQVGILFHQVGRSTHIRRRYRHEFIDAVRDVPQKIPAA